MSDRMRRGSAFALRSSYTAAAGGSRRIDASMHDSIININTSDNNNNNNNNNVSQQLQDHGVFLEAEYYPTDEECQILAAPITDFLSRCTSYDVLGTSTQVVVLDVDVALAVAFIAAQETRLNACVLWDPNARVFCGMMSSTDYIDILLYCHDNPEEAEQVARYTIREWKEKRRSDNNNNDNNIGVDKRKRTSSSSSSPSSFSASQLPPTSHVFVACTPDTPLGECLQQILHNHVRRIAVLVEKGANDVSVVAILDLQQILVYLGAVFLSLEAAGGGGGGGRRGIVGSVVDVGSTTIGSNGDVGNNNNNNNSSSSSHIGGGNNNNNNNNNNNSSSSNNNNPSGVVDPTDFAFLFGEYALPPHVHNLLFAPHEGGEPECLFTDFGKEPNVGPYRAIFDIPFCYIPQLGKHREHVISVMMDSSLLQALRLMLQYNIESIAVVSDEFIILDVIDRSDVVRIEDQGVYNTNMTVREALGNKVSGKICVFHLKDSLRDIFIHFVRKRVKELFIVDPDTDKLIGQLNVAEMVFFLAFGVTTSTKLNNNNNNNNNNSGSVSQSTTGTTQAVAAGTEVRESKK